MVETIKIEEIIFKKQGKWFNASTGRNISPALAKRYLRYYSKFPLSMPWMYARGERAKVDQRVAQQIADEKKSATSILLKTPIGRTRILGKRIPKHRAIDVSPIPEKDYGPFINFAVPKLEEDLRQYENIDLEAVKSPHSLQTKLERYVPLDLKKEGGRAASAKGWTAKRVNVLADYLDIPRLQVLDTYKFKEGGTRQRKLKTRRN